MKKLLHHPAVQKGARVSKRLTLGIGGPLSYSAANFLLSFLLLGHVPAAQFGLFAFVQTMVSFGFGLSNALFSSPLMAAMQRHHQTAATVAHSFFYTSALFSLAGGMLITGIVLAFGQPFPLALMLGISAACLWLSRLGRSYALDHQQPLLVLRSDGAYSTIILLGGAFLWFTNSITFAHVVGVQMAGALLAVALLGKNLLALQWHSLWHGTWQPFISGFKIHGRHALTGVLSTEGTNNFHAYIVTLCFGPGAFAPIAAAALFFRPVPLVLQSLTQFERGRLARLLREGKNNQAWHTIRFFYGAGYGVWLLCIGLAYVLLSHFSHLIFHTEHDPNTLLLATTFYGINIFFSCLQAPASALLQANASFKSLANTTIISCLITIPMVTLMVLTLGPVWSLLGVLAGLITASILTYRLARTEIPRTA